MSESYLPLFRKYRPQSFKNLVGQENLTKALGNAIELNRIANAYLFCGPRGTGKTSSARILAKSLNCETGPTLEPCQKCAQCVDITNSKGLDVIEIDAATNRGVEGAEELITQAHYAPISGKYKIFIIDEVHMLTNTAFNALLKTFEEPPSNVVFILATTEPQKVIETIISRTQRFDFRRITIEDIVNRLDFISKEENINITKEALYTIAKNVSGGLRDSLALLDQVSILGAKAEITKDVIEELLGKVTFDKLIKLLDFIVNREVDSAIAFANEIFASGSEPRNLCENFMEFLRNVIIALNTKDPSKAEFATLTAQEVQEIISKNYSNSNINHILEIVVEYYKEIKFATNPYLWIELFIIAAIKENVDVNNIPEIKLNVAPQRAVETPIAIAPTPQTVQAIPKEAVAELVTEVVPEIKEAPVVKEVIKEAPIAPKEIVEEISRLEEVAPVQEVEPVQVASQSVSQNASQNNVEDGDAHVVWANIVNAIESVPAKFFYSGMAKLIKIEENRIVLGFVNQNVISQAKSDMKFSQLKNGAKNYYGDTYSFEFLQVSEDELKKLKPAPKVEVQRQSAPQPVAVAQNNVENNTFEQKKEQAPQKNEEIQQISATHSPKVKEMLEAFNGKIVD